MRKRKTYSSSMTNYTLYPEIDTSESGKDITFRCPNIERSHPQCNSDMAQYNLTSSCIHAHAHASAFIHQFTHHQMKFQLPNQDTKTPFHRPDEQKQGTRIWFGRLNLFNTNKKQVSMSMSKLWIYSSSSSTVIFRWGQSFPNRQQRQHSIVRERGNVITGIPSESE